MDRKSNKKKLAEFLEKLEPDKKFFIVTGASNTKPFVLVSQSEPVNDGKWNREEAEKEAMRILVFLEMTLPWTTTTALQKLQRKTESERLRLLREYIKKHGEP